MSDPRYHLADCKSERCLRCLPPVAVLADPQVRELVEVAKRLYARVEDNWLVDSGPIDEGWRSDGLQKDIDAVAAVIKKFDPTWEGA